MFLILAAALLLTQECEIQVRVLDAETSQPMGAVHVELRRLPEMRSEQLFLTDNQGGAHFTVYSDTDYEIVASFTGFAPNAAEANCQSAQQTVQIPLEPVQPASIIQLIANPTAWHGKIVRVTGFLRLEFEGNALYLHREDWKKSLFRNAIWVEPSDEMLASSKTIQNRYVLVEGRFDAENRGHFGFFGGALTDIHRFVPHKR